jgi:hypothetical protein
VPVVGLLVEEQLDPQRAHGKIVLKLAQLSDRITVVAGNRGHRRAA